MKKLFLVLLIVAFGLGSLALADTQNFTSPAGLLGNTQTYTLAGQTITASGFCAGVGCPLFAKTLGGDENGLGLANDPSTQDEIFVGAGTFIQIDVNNLITHGITSVDFQMGSTTAGETWTVEECGTSGVLCGGGTSGTDELTTHTISGLTTSTRYLDFISSNGNVLLHNMSATAPVPEPASMIMLGTGLVGLAGTIRRKLRR